MDHQKTSHKHDFGNINFPLDNLFYFEFRKDCTAECIKDITAKFEIYKTATVLFQSLKVNEDGTLPPFRFLDVVNYYCGMDSLCENKNIQDLFSVNILDLSFPDATRRTDIPTKKEN
ncbi:hypothetical protein ACTFIZ_004734 [Dictyostelium cf. discoideum]